MSFQKLYPFFLCRHPIQGAKEITVKCDVPAKLVVKAEPRRNKDDAIKYAANPENGRVRRLRTCNMCNQPINANLH